MKVVDLSRIIQPLKARQAAHRRRQPFTPVSLDRLALLEEAEALVAGCLDELIREIPELETTRRLYDGAWYLGVKTTLARPTRKASTSSTRFEVALRLDASGASLHVATHATVLDQELEERGVTVGFDEAGQKLLRDTVEAGAMDFARRFFESAPSRPA